MNARQGLFAENLPSNADTSGANLTPHDFPAGWTVQEPWPHHRAVVPLRCLYCARALEGRQWTRHACPVRGAIDGRP